MQPRKPFRLRYPVIVGILGLVMLVGGGVYIGILTQFQNPAACVSTPCFAAALIALAGFVMVHRSVKGTLDGLVRAGYLPGKRPKSIPQIGSGPEDERVLMIANELLAQSKLGKIHSVESLSWADGQPWYVCTFKRRGWRKPPQLVLSAGLRGRLEPGDWKMLLAYNFCQLRPPHGPLLRSMVWMLLPFLLSLFVAFLVSTVYGRVTGALFGSIVLPFIGVLSLLRMGPLTRKMFLKVDRLIARSVGSLGLLNLFKRIDGLKLPEVEIAKRREGWIARLWPMPNMAERIENLQSWTPDSIYS